MNRLLLAANLAVFIYMLTLIRQPAVIAAFYDRYSFDWNAFTGALAAGRLLDIAVLDHLVVGHDAWVSLRDRGVAFDRRATGGRAG